MPSALWTLFPLILTATIGSRNHYCPVFICEDTVVRKVKQFACSLTNRWGGVWIWTETFWLTGIGLTIPPCGAFSVTAVGSSSSPIFISPALMLWSVAPHFTLMAPCRGRDGCYFHFLNKETTAWRSEVRYAQGHTASLCKVKTPPSPPPGAGFLPLKGQQEARSQWWPS